MRSQLSAVLPLLEPYLSVDSETGDAASVTYKRAKSTASSSRRSSHSVGESAVQRASLQRSILRFLGLLGGDNQSMLPDSRSVLRTALMWTAASECEQLTVVADGLMIPVGSCLKRVVEVRLPLDTHC